MTEHPELDLSAFLDGALAPAERAAVQAHLDGCARCAAQLAELRATSRLIAALPRLEPRRSLVPRLDRAPVWLRPVRLLGAIGTGAFAFLFLASAVLNSGSSLGGGTTTAERLASKGQFGAAANAIASDAANKQLGNTPVPAFAPVAGGTTRAPGAPAPAASIAVQDSTRSVASAPSPSPAARSDVATPSAAEFSLTSAEPRPQVGPPPQLFLGLAVLCALAAFVAHRKLRRT